MDGKEPISSSFHGTTTHSKVVRTSNAFSRPTQLPFPLATYPDIGPTGKEGVVVRRTSRLKTYYDNVICQSHHAIIAFTSVGHSQPTCTQHMRYVVRNSGQDFSAASKFLLLISNVCGLVVIFVKGVRIFVSISQIFCPSPLSELHQLQSAGYPKLAPPAGIWMVLRVQKHTLVDLPSRIQDTDKDKFACFVQGCVIYRLL